MSSEREIILDGMYSPCLDDSEKTLTTGNLSFSNLSSSNLSSRPTTRHSGSNRLQGFLQAEEPNLSTTYENSEENLYVSSDIAEPTDASLGQERRPSGRKIPRVSFKEDEIVDEPKVTCSRTQRVRRSLQEPSSKSSSRSDGHNYRRKSYQEGGDRMRDADIHGQFNSHRRTHSHDPSIYRDTATTSESPQLSPSNNVDDDSPRPLRRRGGILRTSSFGPTVEQERHQKQDLEETAKQHRKDKSSQDSLSQSTHDSTSEGTTSPSKSSSPVKIPSTRTLIPRSPRMKIRVSDTSVPYPLPSSILKEGNSPGTNPSILQVQSVPVPGVTSDRYYHQHDTSPDEKRQLHHLSQDIHFMAPLPTGQSSGEGNLTRAVSVGPSLPVSSCVDLEVHDMEEGSDKHLASQSSSEPSNSSVPPGSPNKISSSSGLTRTKSWRQAPALLSPKHSGKTLTSTTSPTPTQIYNTQPSDSSRLSSSTTPTLETIHNKQANAEILAETNAAVQAWDKLQERHRLHRSTPRTPEEASLLDSADYENQSVRSLATTITSSVRSFASNTTSSTTSQATPNSGTNQPETSSPRRSSLRRSTTSMRQRDTQDLQEQEPQRSKLTDTRPPSRSPSEDDTKEPASSPRRHRTQRSGQVHDDLQRIRISSGARYDSYLDTSVPPKGRHEGPPLLSRSISLPVTGDSAVGTQTFESPVRQARRILQEISSRMSKLIDNAEPAPPASPRQPRSYPRPTEEGNPARHRGSTLSPTRSATAKPDVALDRRGSLKKARSMKLNSPSRNEAKQRSGSHRANAAAPAGFAELIARHRECLEKARSFRKQTDGMSSREGSEVNDQHQPYRTQSLHREGQRKPRLTRTLTGGSESWDGNEKTKEEHASHGATKDIASPPRRRGVIADRRDRLSYEARNHSTETKTVNMVGRRAEEVLVWICLSLHDLVRVVVLTTLSTLIQ